MSNLYEARNRYQFTNGSVGEGNTFDTLTDALAMADRMVRFNPTVVEALTFVRSTPFAVGVGGKESVVPVFAAKYGEAWSTWEPVVTTNTETMALSDDWAATVSGDL